MARPSTASARPYTPSSSSSGVWRTGNPSISSSADSNGSIRNTISNPNIDLQQENKGNIDKRKQQISENDRQIIPQQQQTQWRPVTAGRGPHQNDGRLPLDSNGQGLSLTSLLDGNLSDSQSSSGRRDAQLEQQYQQGQRHEQGQHFVTPNLIGRRPCPSSPSGPRPPSASGSRPTTPSALFSQVSQPQQQVVIFLFNSYHHQYF